MHAGRSSSRASPRACRRAARRPRPARPRRSGRRAVVAPAAPPTAARARARAPATPASSRSTSVAARRAPSPGRAGRARTSGAAPATSARSTSFSSTVPGRDRGEQRLAERVRPRAARRRCRPPAPAAAASPRSPATSVQGLQEGDGEVVGGDGPGEPELVAQQGRQQRRVGGGRDAVDVGVGVHHRPGAGSQRHLERRQDDVGELARPDRHRREVAGRARGGVAEEVLERRHRRRRSPGRARRRCRSGRPGTGPRRASPRPGPSAGRGPRRAPAPGPGGCRGARIEPPIRARHPLDQRRVERRRPAQRRRVDRSPATTASPVRHSSCTWAGMPNRFAAITSRCRSARIRSPSTGSSGAVPNGPGQLPEAVGDRPRPTAAAGRRSRAASAPSRRRPGRATRRRRAGRPSPRRSSGRPGRRPAPSTGAVGSRQSSVTMVTSRGCGRRATHQRRLQGHVRLVELLAGDQRDQHRDRVVAHPPHRLLRRSSAAGAPARTRGCCRSRPPTAGRARRRRARRRPRGSPARRCRWPRRSRSAARAATAASRAASRACSGSNAPSASSASSTGDAGRGVRLAVALLAQLGGDQVRPAGDHADAACGRGSSRWSTPSRAPCRLSAATVGRLRPAGVRVDGDDRAVVLHVGDGRGDQHRAVDERAHHPRQVAPLPADVLVDAAAGGVGDQLVAGAADRVRRALEHLGAERLEVRDQHADHVGAVVAQAARHQAGLVAEPRRSPR